MEKTIAAISTAMSASGIGIVRISGDEAMDVISRIYRSKNGKKNIREVQSHTIHYGSGFATARARAAIPLILSWSFTASPFPKQSSS